ncbi:DUF4381 domain-containing protein [Spongorhabdus nitratireducens]
MSTSPQLQPTQNPLLEQLRPDILPEPVDWWPPAPGWWLLAGIAILVVLFLGYRLIRFYIHRRYRREALKAVKRLHQSAEKMKPAQLLGHYNRILKQASLAAFPDQDIAGLHGSQWLSFLDDSANTKGFTHGHGRALGSTRFAPAPEVDIEGLYRLASHWIRKHHV